MQCIVCIFTCTAVENQLELKRDNRLMCEKGGTTIKKRHKEEKRKANVFHAETRVTVSHSNLLRLTQFVKQQLSSIH